MSYEENAGKEAQRTSREFMKQHLDHLRAGLAEWDMLNSQHQNHEAGDHSGCPVCGPSGDARRAARLDALASLPDPDTMKMPTRKCLCDGTRFVDDSEGKTRPCNKCNPAAHERWRTGSMGANSDQGIIHYGA